jgi:two-component system sensor histidine kinase UhpB
VTGRGISGGRPGDLTLAIAIRRIADADLATELAAELHDRVIGSVSALILEMEQFKREQFNRASVQSSVTGFQDSMREALGELREVVNRMQGGPPAGFADGLVEAIRTGPLADLQRKTGAATNIVASSRFPRVLEASTQIQLYRITEQALHNAAQHSGAANVTVSFRVDGGYVVVQVADDGCGYNWATRFSGQGLTGMQQRALLIGGRLEIDNRPGGGTVVRVRAPLRGWS